jgi:hypothetical protein
MNAGRHVTNLGIDANVTSRRTNRQDPITARLTGPEAGPATPEYREQFAGPVPGTGGRCLSYDAYDAAVQFLAEVTEFIESCSTITATARRGYNRRAA